MNASSLGVTMFCCDQMKSYTSKSFIYRFTVFFKYSDFMFYITDNLVIGQIMTILCVITILLNYCKGGYRLRYADLEKKYGENAKNKKGDKSKNKKDSKKENLL